ncbi:hypothetical protein JQ615_41755 [Bradyrhizobium jicamae]|uniref:Uncharacterized protein n=1 Tax=Bradyrhizobium jicamae TaxID=280332 RepID=A0ABS5G084_9BRAD|nr:hypothetical protein [Bradyrhizobium jicamae]MBR0801856.1 hypothetical protein [Bradyrhizobium jicamae]MBR0939527.1 hypothetical protein [Bradyrhizobium jicamae]
MSQVDRTASNVTSLFHQAAHYNSPADVLNDAALSRDEKRVILSSWASDMYVVESRPAFREVPGIPHRLRLDDILTGLKQLDDDGDPPPRGGMAMRLPRFSKVECTGVVEPQRLFDRHSSTRRYRSIRVSRTTNGSRWTREANVRRYRKLLDTQLSDVERRFIERRLAEELQG